MSTSRGTTFIVNLLREPTAILSILLVLLYLATLTADYYWDGITFALQVEKVAKSERGSYLLFHQNHLLYNCIGYVIYRVTSALGLTMRALNLLQVTNVIAGAAAVCVFFRMIERASRNRYAALVSSIALAVSAVWWKLATDTNAYILSLLLMLVCVSNLLGAKPRWYVAGLALAGAMLIHQLASLFYPAAVVAVFTNRNIERKWRFAAGMSSIAWGLTISIYYTCAVLLHGIHDPLGVMRWAAANPSGASPSLNPLPGLLLLPRTNVDMVVGHSFSFFRSQASYGEWAFALAALLTALLFVFKAARRANVLHSFKGLFQLSLEMNAMWKQIAPVTIVWIGTYLVFLIFWEPWLVYYRAFYVPALALAFGFAISNYHCLTDNAPSGTAVLAVAALAFFNLAFYIGPHMRVSSNMRVLSAYNANKVWDQQTIIYFSDRNEADTTFEYFNETTEWRRLTPASRTSLDNEIQRAYSQGRSIWLNKGAAESVDPDWLSKRARGKEIKLESANAPARYVELLPNL